MCWTGSTRCRVFWTRNSFFLLTLNFNPPRQEADRRSIFFWNRCHFGLSRKVINATFCHLSCQCSSMLYELYCPLHQSGVAVAWAANTVNTRQSESVTVFLFFCPLTPTHGHFVLSPVLLASRDQDGVSLDSTIDIYLRSHRKIGDCEQCNLASALPCGFGINFLNHEFDYIQ